jgi:hypothetical protein
MPNWNAALTLIIYPFSPAMAVSDVVFCSMVTKASTKKTGE